MALALSPVIEVYADIWCPFAHVGLRAVAAQRTAHGREDVVLRVWPWPLELVNGAPLDPLTTVRHAGELREQVAPELFSDLDLSRFPSSTLSALALVEEAYGVDARLGEALSFDVRDELFERGHDISDPDVLEDLAQRHGLGSSAEGDQLAVLDAYQRGRQRGVLGSPHFFCKSFESFCPSLDLTRDEQHGLIITANAVKLGGFLEECLSEDDAP